MNTKIFRVEDILFTELSPRKGSIEYFLIDGVKGKRKVTGIAELSSNGKIKSVRAVYLREKPLLDVLVEADVGQRITVDFTEHNKVKRVRQVHSKHQANVQESMRTHGDISATMVYQELYDDLNYNEKLKNILPDMSKVGVWFVFLFIVWLVFMAINQLSVLLK